ncbi:MAG: hypothetical protein IKF17_05885 [Clostridia bacterium]|nr:hypothetical protein [Clostridia bacterium]
MNNNFITVVLTILIVGLLGCMLVFGIEAYKELDNAVYSDENVNQYGVIEKKEEISTPQVVEQPIDNIESTPASNTITYQSSASKNHYFYNQLDSYSKSIYDGIVANKDNMKSGTYKLEFGNAFSDILSQANGKELLGSYYQNAVEAFTYDNPEIFYLDPTKMYLNISTTTKGNKKTYNVYISNSEGSNYLAKGYSSREQIEQCQAEIEQVKNKVLYGLPGTTEKKIKQIHDYLVDNLSYDQALSGNNIYNLYGALVNKSCVCEGYAKAFKYLLDEAGIDSVIVIGTASNSKGETENHAWNYVAIDGAWYAVDSTWDDPVIQGGGMLTSTYKYKYYLKGAQTMAKDHIANGQFTTGGKIYSYPSISNYDYK